jgi:hypothetical protein
MGIQMRLRMCLAAVALTAVVLAVWLFIPRLALSPAPPKLAAIPVLEKLHWGMTVSEVRGLYPLNDIPSSAGGKMFVTAAGTLSADSHRYAMYSLKRYPWQGCLANASLLFAPDGQLTQIWLDDHPDSPRPCKVMALAQIEQHFGEGTDQKRLAPTVRIADCRPLTPQDRTWPAHMGRVWRCWKKDGTLVRTFDGEPQPLILSKAGAAETPFARPSVDPLWGY